MTDLRQKLENARKEYRAAVYDGDLAVDLLGAQEASPRHANTWSADRLRWFIPALAGAIAAMVAIAVWQHHAKSTSAPAVQLVNNQSATKPDGGRAWPSLPAIPLDPIVQDVRSSMKQAVDELANGVGRATPILRGSVESVRDVADEFKEQATETWKQMRKPKSGTLLDPAKLPDVAAIFVA
jgi:hypothetical protein